VRLKPDSSYVTDVDLQIERFVRSRLEARFPHHSVVGEEFGASGRPAEFLWCIDPIDGTRSFAHGIPLFGTILTLLVDGSPVVGVIDHPALDLTFHAALGLGAFRGLTQLTITDTAPVKNVLIGIGERRQFIACKKTHVFDEVMRQHPGVRTYCDCFGHTLVAAGSLAGMLDVNLALWDYAATGIMISEAGGTWAVLDQREDGRADIAFGAPSVVRWLQDRYS
jgi:fructose-1,6-bisphosphatase/inositol monophosphatase family enzyme